MMHFRLFAILLLLVAGSTTVVSGQTQQEPALDMEFTDIPLSEAISRIEKNTRYTFFYDAKQTNLSQRVSLKAKRMPISAALKEMLAPTGLNFTITERQIALIPARKAAARQRTIAGVVNDSSETPLAGVAVTLVGDNTRGAVTEANGSFTLTVPDADITLSFTYLGYVSKKVAVPATQNNVKVFLTEDAVKMEDVVVVGYGTQKKVNLTGAIATVDEKQLQNRSAPSVAHMLQGSVPGLTVSTSSGRPGNPASLNIRGITSINGGSPLVLVDGAEGDLMKINPNDVASISVVKDASAAAIYGARAAFGVVLVTTKSGDSSGKTRISYSGRWGWNEPTTSTDYETRGYYSVYLNDLFWRSYAGNNYTRYTEQDMMELWARRNDRTEHPDRPWVKIDQRDGRDTYVYYGNTDWYHYLFKDEHPNTSHSISLSGGNDRVDYLLSGSYYSEEGLFRQHPDKLQKITFRSKITFDINKWLKVSNNTSYYNYKYFYPGPSDVNTAFSWSTVHGLASFVPVNPDGTSVYNTSFSNYQIMDGLPTILNKDGHTNDDHTDNMSTTTELTWTPIKGLEIKGNFTYMFNTTRYTNRQVNTEYSQYPGEINTLTSGKMEDKLYEKSMTHTYYQANLYGTFERTFARDHNFKAMVGFNWETKFLKDVAATGYNLLSETLNDLNLVGQGADGEKRMEVGGGQNEYALMGFFGRLNYDYKGKYLVEASGRYDGTSRFKRGQRWGFFPSFSLGWRVSEEAFFDGIRDQFNNLKLRFSYGQLGNQNVGYYDYIRKISIGSQNYLFGGDKPTTATISAPVASDLSWERSIHKNLGVDMSFLNNRLAFSADFYIRDTKDMLTAGIALPATYGADADLQRLRFEHHQVRQPRPLLRQEILRRHALGRNLGLPHRRTVRLGRGSPQLPRRPDDRERDHQRLGRSRKGTARRRPEIPRSGRQQRNLHRQEHRRRSGRPRNHRQQPAALPLRRHAGAAMGRHRLLDLLPGNRPPGLVPGRQRTGLLGSLRTSLRHLPPQELPHADLVGGESELLFPPSARLHGPAGNQPRADGRQRPLPAKHRLLPSEKPHGGLHAAQTMDPQGADREPAHLLHGRKPLYLVGHPLGLHRP